MANSKGYGVVEDERAVSNLRQYLQIRSDHPKPDYGGCVVFLKKIADDIGLKSKVVYLKETHPVLILTLEGKSADLQSILLNSHMDVVPASEEDWKHDPFSGFMEENGDIYGRGTLDMKGTTIAELEALRRLKESGVELKRNVHMTILPDEEIGSAEGMAKFVDTEAFRSLDVGFDLDEGGCNDNEIAHMFKNERCQWAFNIHCPGTTGHGSLLQNGTAGEKARVVIDHFMDFREREKQKLKTQQLADVTTINLTTLEGGVQNNVLPQELIVGFDMRISADADHEEIKTWMEGVCKKAGEGVYVEFLRKSEKVPSTDVSGNSYCATLIEALHSLGVKTSVENLFASSDARFVRKKKIAAIGFTPFFNSDHLYHANNEYINKNVFLKGISYYVKIIEALANC